MVLTTFPNDVLAELAVQRLHQAKIPAYWKKAGLGWVSTGDGVSVAGPTAVLVDPEHVLLARKVLDLRE